MSKEVIYEPKAPEPIGPYSQAIMHNGTLYVSGQIAIDQESGDLITGDIARETEQVMKNLGMILGKAGLSYNHVLKCSIFLNTMEDLQAVNAVYGKYFKENPPARETVAVKGLPKNVNVEISCIAAS